VTKTLNAKSVEIAMCEISTESEPSDQEVIWNCYPRYLGITRRSCLEAHMVLDMEYRERD
jgi:hypothetical protein